MKTIVASVIAAVGASACCLGPFVLPLVGAGALGAAATQLEPFRPLLLGLTFVLLGSAFHVTYRRPRGRCATDGPCATSSNQTAKVVLWIATVFVISLVAFPYYIEWLV